MLSRLKDYFRIHDLDRYLTDVIPLIDGKRRCGEINEIAKYSWQKIDIAEYFFKYGGKVILIDEIHKYPN